MTHLLFLRRHASHGRSFRLRMLDAPPALLGILVDTFGLILSLSGDSVFALDGLAAIAIGAARATVDGVDMA
jgi:hypothetical protein